MPTKKKASKKKVAKKAQPRKKAAKKKVVKKRLQKRKGRQYKPPSRVDVRELCTENAHKVAQKLIDSILCEGAQKVSLDAEQLAAARIILNKSLPDLKAIEATVEVSTPTPIEIEFI